jgi:hypothetical protein
MLKKEYHKQINKRFYAFVENEFPQYTIDSGEGYGRIYLIPKEGIMDDSIMYHQSEHYVQVLNFASEQAKQDCLRMQDYIVNNIVPFVNLHL